MEDLTGLGKLAESKLANKAYDDALSKAAKEVGKSAEDIAKTFRLFLAPFQLLAVAQDRLAGFCKRVRSEVPAERQIEADPSIAGPVLFALRYREDDSPVTEMFLNLLKRCIDRERVHEAHPAYPKIIEQLSPDEAMILYKLSKPAKEKIPRCGANWLFVDHLPRATFSLSTQEIEERRAPLDLLAFPENMNFYCTHLSSLSLINHEDGTFLYATQFGEAFMKA